MSDVKRGLSPATMVMDDEAVITVSGALDATTAPDFKRMVTDFFEVGDRSDTDVLTLDLSSVSACDQAARDLVRYAQSVCADRAMALRVVPSAPVSRALTRH
jgi:anti-anti-sigma regulatory factor